MKAALSSLSPAIRRALIFLGLGLLLSPVQSSAADDPLKPFLKQYCFDCHDSAMHKADLDLEALSLALDDDGNFRRWVRIFDRVDQQEMPPPNKPRPDIQGMGAFLAQLKQSLLAQNQKRQKAEGRTVLRRLNRIEYERSVQDVLGISTPLQELLPLDTSLHGFDTVSEGLRLSALQFEGYLEAAEVAINALLKPGPSQPSQKKRYSLKQERLIRENLDIPDGVLPNPTSKTPHKTVVRELPDGIALFHSGFSLGDFRQYIATRQSRFRVRVAASVYQGKGLSHVLRLYAVRYQEKRLLGYFTLPPTGTREFESEVELLPGEYLRVAPYDTGYDDQGRSIYQMPIADFKGVGIAVHWMELEGPIPDPIPAGSVKAFLEARRGAPVKSATEVAFILKQTAGRAFRREPTPDELERLSGFAVRAQKEGGSPEEGLRQGLKYLITAPQFLFMEAQPGALTASALASRLSYFLWSAPPDDALRSAARSGELLKPDVLRAQTERLLSHPNSRELIRNFGGQWLGLRNIDATSPDARLYPEYDEVLRHSMLTETEEFLSEILRQNLGVTNFIHSDFLMLDRRLADHYGIPGVDKETFQKVAVPGDSVRGGLLGQASILKVSANGTTTSPVMRGVWVMKHLLGTTPPPPPSDVVKIEPDTRGATTIREQLDKHRNTAACATCHRIMDPPGFALESFDVIGGWRDNYRVLERGRWPTNLVLGRSVSTFRVGPPVDASGQLIDGNSFQDIRGFKKLLMTRQDEVIRSVTQNLLIYATGAGIQFADREEVARLVTSVKQGGGGFRTLLHEIVQSPLFREK